MHESPDVPIRKFNPGTFQSDEDVIRQFVVRNQQLDAVLEVLRNNIDAPSCQHVLVVSPRGQGKSMLLARVAAEMRTNNDFSDRLLPVRFMEESQEIFHIADFWLETLFYFGKTIEKSDPDLSKELQRTHASLADRWSEQATGDHARSAVLSAADRLEKRLVLMVENLQALSGAVDEHFGWQLRQVLQSEPRIMLLATATTRFEGLDDAAEPFFELFRIINLKRLSTEECRSLWQVVSGDTVESREIRPLEILTGGSPRLVVIVAGLARHRSLRQLMEELVTLVDDHTEYFRSHLDVLPKGERRVYIAVLDLRRPSTASEIAKRARMDIRVVSTMLGRLAERGVVAADETSHGRRRVYVATEPLYGIYYRLRRERDEAAIVHRLIHFMSAFYRADELASFSNMLRLEAKDSEAVYEGMQRAITETPQLVEVLGIAVTEHNEESALAAASKLGNEAVRQNRMGNHKTANGTWDELIERFGGNEEPGLRQWVAVAFINKGVIQDELGESEAAIACYDEVIRRFGASDEPRLQDWIAIAFINRGGWRSRLGEPEAAIVCYDEVIRRFGASGRPTSQEMVAKALVNKGEVQERLGEFKAAITTWDEAIKRSAGNDTPDLRKEIAKALVNKGAVQNRLGEFKAAITTWDEAIKRFGDGDGPDFQKEIAKALLYEGAEEDRLGRYEAALAMWDEVIKRFGKSADPELQEWVAFAWNNKGAWHGKLGEFEEAIDSYDKVIERFGASDNPALQKETAKAQFQKGAEQERLGEQEAAVATWDEVIKGFGDRDAPELQEWVARALEGRAVWQVELRQYEAAVATWDEVIQRLGDSANTELQVMVAKTLVCKGLLQDHLGECEAAIASYEEVIERFGGSNAPEIGTWVAKMMIKRGVRLIESGHAEETLRICDEVEHRFGGLNDVRDISYQWWSDWLRTKAVLGQQDKYSEASLALFRRVYAALVPENETMMGETLSLVTDLMAAGASAHHILQVLLSDERKADVLEPLVVALCEVGGEHVRAPKEIVEVASDIRKQFEERKKTLRREA